MRGMVLEERKLWVKEERKLNQAEMREASARLVEVLAKQEEEAEEEDPDVVLVSSEVSSINLDTVHGSNSLIPCRRMRKRAARLGGSGNPAMSAGSGARCQFSLFF